MRPDGPERGQCTAHGLAAREDGGQAAAHRADDRRGGGGGSRQTGPFGFADPRGQDFLAATQDWRGEMAGRRACHHGAKAGGFAQRAQAGLVKENNHGPEHRFGCVHRLRGVLGDLPFCALVERADGKVEVNEACTLCGACLESCPTAAISMEEVGKQVEAAVVDNYRGLWVFAEQRSGKIQEVAFELLGEGRELADQLGVELCAVLLGHQVKELAATLFEHGADKI